MGTLTADRAAIEGFLAQAGGEAIHLVSIPAEGGPTLGHWFGADAACAADWAAKRNADGSNIYWSPNPPHAGLHKKARKEDVAAVRYAHVDIDPPKGGGGFDKAAVVAKLQAAEVPPSLVVDSGGGIQALWRLEGPAPADIEGINRSLIKRFGGDTACSNIDRVLRVPGTVNLPNAKKRGAGRVPVAAALLGATGEATTSAQLIGAYVEAAPERAGAASPAVLAGGLTALDALGLGVADPLRQMLTNPRGDDRSADTYAAACGLVRGGYSDAQVAAVLLEAELPISAHCLAEDDPERAARRAIAKARAEAASELAAFAALGSGGSISATPYGWPASYSIPPRRWLYGAQLLRGTVAVIVAPGATGKSALTVGMALALATGRPLLGKEVHGGPRRVWLYNLEDAREELDRSIAAAAWAHGIRCEDAGDRLFVDSGLTDAGLCTAVTTRQGFTILQPVFDAIVAELNARRIDCIIVDPFVSSHQVSENDNGAIDAVAKAWARVAAAADCAIVLVHHTSKAAGMEVTVDRARGASALTNAARSVLTLNRMTSEEGQGFGIVAGEERRYFRTYDDKNNRAPPAEASDWYYLDSVDLPNGEGDEWVGDSVGVAMRWEPPAAGTVEPLAPSLAADVQRLIAQGEWRDSHLAERWAGKAVAQVLGLDPDDKAQRGRIKATLKALVADGTLAKVEKSDRNHEKRTWVVAGSKVATDPAVVPVVRDQQCGSAGLAPISPRTAVEPPIGRSTTAVRYGVAGSVQKTEVAKNHKLAETAPAPPGQVFSAPDTYDGSDLV